MISLSWTHVDSYTAEWTQKRAKVERLRQRETETEKENERERREGSLSI